MIRHFFLDKTNTIYKGSFTNTGLNPVLELNCGKQITRGLVHFDESEILKMAEEGEITDISKLKCTLKMTNCYSIDSKNTSFVYKDNETYARRASSFDVIAFKLPQHFDEGRGFDNVTDFWDNGEKYHTNFGSSWFFSSTNGPRLWPVDKDKIDFKWEGLNIDIDNGKIWIKKDGEKKKIDLDGGIYSNVKIAEELLKYESGVTSLIIGTQHFDYGQENLEIDITNYVLDIISGNTENFGIGLMFSLPFETWETRQQYVGFFTDHTNTVFHPYVELIYDNPINDDRENFCIGKENNLYLYVDDEGVPVNLDELPTCTINEEKYEVQHTQKGVYCAKIKALRGEMEEGTIGYDNWSNLAYNGQEIEDIEMEFEVKPSKMKIGNISSERKIVSPSIYGIGDNEDLNQGEIREVSVDFRKQYEGDRKELIDSAEYEIYIKIGSRKINVIDFTPIEKAYLNNFFVVHTEDLIPCTYYIGIRVKSGREMKYFDNVLKFNIVSNVTDIHQ